MRNQHLPITAVFLMFIFGFALLDWVTPPQDVSEFERRDLAQFPVITLDRLLSGEATADYATYMQDQAAFRDELRFFKSFIERRGFLKKENNGVYVAGDRIFDKFYGINHALIERTAQRIDEVVTDIDASPIYLAIIPTKAQMLDSSAYLLSDQYEIADTVAATVDATYIDLMRLATPGNEDFYYITDPHWTTDGAISAYRRLAEAMGLESVTDYDFEVATDSYIGSEYGRAAAWNIPKDTIYLAHNEILDGMSFCRFRTLDEADCYDSVYVELDDDTADRYDIFLGGLAPITVITNDLAPEGSELVVFKDSYGHALAPFLAQHYRTVTLVDFRYIQRELVLENVNLDGATALFLYSTSVLNTDQRIVD